MKWTVNARYSSNYANILISVFGQTIEYGYKSLEILYSPSNCSMLFTEDSLLLLSNYAICAWDIQKTEITIYLSPSSIIQLDDTLTFKEGAWDYEILGETFRLKEAINISSILPPIISSESPTIVFGGASLIGACDTLVFLDALASFGFGKGFIDLCHPFYFYLHALI